ncbi:MAG: hypothetical protein DI629_02960 [Mesorhizobium amorphae]|nr:MAG: hypothetical protein DI629_02960 [Mesorhizobium amorphae]
MIKFVAAGLWLCIVSLGAAYFATHQSTEAEAKAAAEPAPPLLGGLDYVKSDVISVPVLREGTVVGYLLTRLVFTIEPQKLQKLSVPADAILADEVYTYIFGHPQLDFSSPRDVDLDVFRAGIRDSVNKRVGDTLMHDVLIEQIDFLSKNDIRDNAIRRRTGGGRVGDKMASPDSHF